MICFFARVLDFLQARDRDSHRSLGVVELGAGKHVRRRNVQRFVTRITLISAVFRIFQFLNDGAATAHSLDVAPFLRNG
jgi:hypothetical protein